ncbi:MAG TPA: hypothetical protein PKI20_16315 [Verrucomicrobiota bacterium]|nr:hypothetical protein [Verrucomicrobiota bacterium]
MPNFRLSHPYANPRKVAKKRLARCPIHEAKRSDGGYEGDKHAGTRKLTAKWHWPNEPASECDCDAEVKPARDGVSHADLAERKKRKRDCSNGDECDAHGQAGPA